MSVQDPSAIGWAAARARMPAHRVGKRHREQAVVGCDHCLQQRCQALFFVGRELVERRDRSSRQDQQLERPSRSAHRRTRFPRAGTRVRCSAAAAWHSQRRAMRRRPTLPALQKSSDPRRSERRWRSADLRRVTSSLPAAEPRRHRRRSRSSSSSVQPAESLLQILDVCHYSGRVTGRPRAPSTSDASFSRARATVAACAGSAARFRNSNGSASRS